MPDIVLDYRRKIKPLTFSTEAQDTTVFSTTSESYVLAKTINVNGDKIRYISFVFNTDVFNDVFNIKITYYDGTNEYTLFTASYSQNSGYVTKTFQYFFSRSGAIRFYISITPYYSGDSAYLRTVTIYASTDYTSFTRSSSSNIVALIGVSNYYHYVLINSTDTCGVSTQVNTSITTVVMSKDIIIPIPLNYELIILSTI
jgi:hypothetical protein